MIREALLGTLAAASASGAGAQAYTLDEFDLPRAALMNSHPGTVEAVRETPVRRRYEGAFGADVLELTFHPDRVEALDIRLDSGPLVTLLREPGLRVRPGQRVRVTLPP